MTRTTVSAILSDVSDSLFPFPPPLFGVAVGTAVFAYRKVVVVPSDEVLVSRDQLSDMLRVAEALPKLIEAIEALDVRDTSPGFIGVPVDLQQRILERWGDVAAAERGIPSDTRAGELVMDVFKGRVPIGDLAMHAASEVIAWMGERARPALDLRVPS